MTAPLPPYDIPANSQREVIRAVVHGPADDGDRAGRIELILDRIDALPTLSPIASRLLEMCSDADAGLADVVGLIESDPALTTKILGLCRRADRGLGDRITTVRLAVVMLGLDAVRSAVLSVAVYDLLQDSGLDAADEAQADPQQPGLDRVEFWRHLLGVACAAELLAEEAPHLGVRPDEAFVAGLLHDIGKLALDLTLRRSYGRVIALAEARQTGVAGVARSVIGLDHHTAGKRLAEHWDLPQPLQDVMWLHSQPLASLPNVERRNLIALVTLAKSLCRELHVGASAEFGPIPSSRSLAAQLGVDTGVLEEVAPELHEAVAERSSALGLDNASSPELLLRSITSANAWLSRKNVILETKSRLAEEQGQVLDAVARFWRLPHAGRGLVDTLGAIGASAAELLSTGGAGALLRAGEREPWRILRIGAEGRIIEASTLDAADAEPLDALCQLDLGAEGPMPAEARRWRPDALPARADGADLRALALTGPDSALRALLLLDRRLTDGPAASPHLRALIATWSAAVDAAAQHESVRRLGERLAETNRSLVEAQSELAEAQAMARLGEITAGAAHEMNNPLMVISGRSQLLLASLASEADRDAAEAISAAAVDLSNLITSLRLLSSGPAPEAAPAPVPDLVNEAIRMADTRRGCASLVHVTGAEAQISLVTDRELVAGALAELIVNSAEADPGGTIELAVHTDPENDRMVFTVTDGGPGMSQRALEHAFDPFFSEKPAGRQTGLGLTRARRMVEICGGTLNIRNGPAGGCAARVELPGAGAARAAA